ncbi:MAG: helix-hairpin-helix domain-containing protein [Rikenellaceae bacterium]|jgi:DNA uptake protein ComE-like DNA-binding protein|nr:helix-hairpin-helix domain-containing protein [Rikenellaceae bacterium]
MNLWLSNVRKFTVFLENLIGTFFGYTRAERNGIVLIVLLVTVILSGICLFPPRALDTDYLKRVDALNDSARRAYFQRNGRRFSDSLSTRSSSGSNRNRSATSALFITKPTVYIELNGADSAKLTTVRGIGPVISRNIVRYRERLGGFLRKEQLREVWGITDENFEAISAQFFIDTAVIQKIDINFVPANRLREHPYFTPSMANRVLEARQTKGGWNTLTELINKDILLPDEAEKVAPYVVFGTH